MRLWNQSHYRATKAQPSLCISTNTKCYDIDSGIREYDDICTNRDPLSLHAVFCIFVFPYEVERLVDVCVCVCKLACITDMYIISNGYRMRIRCY